MRQRTPASVAGSESNSMKKSNMASQAARRPTRRVTNQMTQGQAMILVATIACFVAIVIFVMAIQFSRHYNFEDNINNNDENHQQLEDTHRIFSDPKEISQDLLLELDAILVLGGGAPSSWAEPPVYVQRRCDHAATIRARRAKLLKEVFMEEDPSSMEKDDKEIKKRMYDHHISLKKWRYRKNHWDHELPILCLSAGTAHVPQLMDANGLPIYESTASAAYLALHHNITDFLFVETTSYDTIGNAYFARTSHTDIANWKRLLIVTSEFHMARTQSIFEWIYSLEESDSDRSNRHNPASYSKLNRYHLHYLASGNAGLSEEALQARMQKEHDSLQQIHEYAAKYTTLSDVWEFLTHHHGLYTTQQLIQRASQAGGSEASDLVKKSYGAP